LKEKVKKAAQKVGMINPLTGQLKGYIPEDFDIWVPPKKITHQGQKFDAVKMVEGEDGVKLVFLVPYNRLNMNDEVELYVEKKIVNNDDDIENDKGITKGDDLGWEKAIYKKGKVNNNLPPYGESALRETGWTKKENTTGLIDDFILLEPFSASETEEYTDLDKTIEAERIDNTKRNYLAFAKRWGPLWISDNPSPADKYIYNGLPVIPWVESIEVWSDFALKVKTALIIAILLNRGDPVRAETWHELHSSTDIEFEVPESVEEQRKWFAWFLNMQTAIDYDVSYFLDWTNDKPKIGLRANTGFLSAVWFQLLQAVTMQTLTICDGCGKAYDRETKPKKGQNNYCKNCRRKAPKKAWYDRNSEKVNEQRRLKRQQKGIILQGRDIK